VSQARSAIVIGAGVVGVTTAYALARRGVRVTIVDRAEGPARGASFANGAQLSYVYTDALASPAMLRKLPMLLLGQDPAFRIRRLFDPGFIDWGLRFLRNCNDARFNEATIAGLALGLESRKALDGLLARHPIEFGHGAPGKMHLHHRESEFRRACDVMRLKRSHGAEQEAITWREAVAIEPALASAPEAAGVIHTPAEAVGDPFRFTVGLLEVLQRRYGVRTKFGFAVKRLQVGQGRGQVLGASGELLEADRLAVCAGVDAPRLLRQMGLPAPVWPMKGYSLTAPLGVDAPRLSITDASRKIVFCRLSGQARIAGLAELGAWNTRPARDRLLALTALAQAALPGAADYETATHGWSGLRPMSPSSLPIIARPRPELVINVGHGMLGWTYAMGAAERAAALLHQSRQ